MSPGVPDENATRETSVTPRADNGLGGPRILGFVAWRLMGVATILAALHIADTVWHVNRHVGRMELARIFAMAMSMPREPVRRQPAISRRPIRRFRGPIRKPTTREAVPFSMNPTDWIRPGEEPEPLPNPEPSPSAPLSPSEPSPPREPLSPRELSPPPSPEPLQPPTDSMRETQVSEVTRQTWTLLCLVILECVALAGASAALGMRRARRNLTIAAALLVAGTGLTVQAGYVITRWGGFPSLLPGDYALVVWRGAGFAAVLLAVVMLPVSGRYSRAVRQRFRSGEVGPWLAQPVHCGLLCVAVAVVCAGAAIFGCWFHLPAWHIVRWVLIGWAIPAGLLGLVACRGRRSVLRAAHICAAMGLLVQFVCWGLPFATLGPPIAIKTILVVLPVTLVTMGRLGECLRLMPKTTAGSERR